MPYDSLTLNVITNVSTDKREVIMTELKIIAIGNSHGVILPRKILEKLRLEKDDRLFCIETPQGVELTPYRPDFAKQMELGENILRENRDVLRKLAQ